ncbi:MAG TPA: sigma-54 dependent transcriptional regulator, partial [Pyrinomonadaceae bacterium]
VAINCAAIPATLIESELFGYEKGAFTDAKARKEGLFEQAEGGTLFLDEIGELELGLQAKLLRVLEEGTFRRVGGLKDIPLDVRVIAASNRDLKAESGRGRFREDLYYRLSIIQIDIPPLRERGDDILLLAEFYLRTLGGALRRAARSISPEVAEALSRYPWPGNVRELRNVIERALILEEGDTVTRKYLPPNVAAGCQKKAPAGNGKLPAGADELFQLPPTGVSVEEVELSLIRQAMAQAGGVQKSAAKLLGLSRDQLRYRLKKLEAPQA